MLDIIRQRQLIHVWDIAGLQHGRNPARRDREELTVALLTRDPAFQQQYYIAPLTFRLIYTKLLVKKLARIQEKTLEGRQDPPELANAVMDSIAFARNALINNALANNAPANMTIPPTSQVGPPTSQMGPPTSQVGPPTSQVPPRRAGRSALSSEDTDGDCSSPEQTNQECPPGLDVNMASLSIADPVVDQGAASKVTSAPGADGIGPGAERVGAVVHSVENVQKLVSILPFKDGFEIADIRQDGTVGNHLHATNSGHHGGQGLGIQYILDHTDYRGKVVRAFVASWPYANTDDDQGGMTVEEYMQCNAVGGREAPSQAYRDSKIHQAKLQKIDPQLPNGKGLEAGMELANPIKGPAAGSKRRHDECDSDADGQGPSMHEGQAVKRSKLQTEATVEAEGEGQGEAKGKRRRRIAQPMTMRLRKRPGRNA
ncbi:MAG: hypothetical protein Q9180_006872 [Flavoplaca navasiana]